MSYASMWEFQVPFDLQPEFEQHYGPGGTWARLFGGSAGYIETILLKDRSTVGRYVTVDRWLDEEAFLAFRSSFSRQYDQLDRDCERLTVNEQWLGVFTECSVDEPRPSER
jgi:heme-degrading monooxygenase HmoA